MNVYQRLTKLIVHMCDENFKATLPDLAKAVGVYEQQLKQDIDFLLSYQAPKGNFLFKPHIKISLSDDNELCYRMDKNKLITYGELLSLTHSQYEMCHFAFAPYGYEPSDISYYNYKEILGLSFTSEEQDYKSDTECLLIAERAIQMGASLAINKYNWTKEKSTTVHMTPHFIKRDINSGELYIVEVYDDGYIEAISLHEADSLDIGYIDHDSRKFISSEIGFEKIYSGYENNAKVESKKIAISDENTARVDSIWSFDGDTLISITDENPTHIRLMIFEDNADILKKIKADTYGRPRASLTGPFPYEEKDHTVTNVYYYEDDVLGLEPFKEWVKRFGASVLVLEPKEIAYDIYREIQQ